MSKLFIDIPNFIDDEMDVIATKIMIEEALSHSLVHKGLTLENIELVDSINEAEFFIGTSGGPFCIQYFDYIKEANDHGIKILEPMEWIVLLGMVDKELKNKKVLNKSCRTILVYSPDN